MTATSTARQAPVDGDLPAEQCTTTRQLDARERRIETLIADALEAARTAETLEAITAARARVQRLEDEQIVITARRRGIAHREAAVERDRAEQRQHTADQAWANLAIAAEPILATIAEQLDQLQTLRADAIAAGAADFVRPEQYSDDGEFTERRERNSVLNACDWLAWQMTHIWPQIVTDDLRRQAQPAPRRRRLTRR